ncbi:MAG TPA: PEP-CTERM sorting domain-containing protein [Chthoniobacterales bacterium]|nr:PEP-CTERM sorting domain-containing protein [Chthoniobacterales bacterium]
MNNKMKSTTCGFRRLAFLGALLLLGAINPAHAIVPTVVVPNSAATTEGDTNNSYPFNLTPFGVPSQRYQQVYAASQFGGLPSGGGFITQIIFRPDATFGNAFTSTLPDIQLDLSTTSAADDGLSSTFANNVGADDTVVFARGPLTLSSGFTGPPNGPKDFDIIITLTTPFFYNPANGNLLMDVRNFGGGSTTFFDAAFTTGDGSSRVFNSDVNSGTGSTDTEALITGFTIVPEPGSAALLLVGGGTLLGWFWGCRRRQRH